MSNRISTSRNYYNSMFATLGIIIIFALAATAVIGISKRRNQTTAPTDDSYLVSALQPYVEGNSLQLESFLDAQGYQCYRSTRDEYLYRDVDGNSILISITGEPDYCFYVGDGESSYRQFGYAGKDDLADAYVVAMSYWEDPQIGNGRLDEQQLVDYYANTKPLLRIINLPADVLNEIANLSTR